MMRLSQLFKLDYGRKLFLLATLPLIFAVAAISIVVTNQSNASLKQKFMRSRHS